MATDPLTSIMGAQPQPTDTGFGSYFRSMPLWLAIGGMAHKPEEFFGGYFDYRQARQQEAQAQLASAQLKAVDKFLLDNFSDADWGDKDIRIQAQRALVERNVPSPIAKQILDNYYVGDNEIMWFDPSEMMLHAHRKDKDGNVTSGTKRIPVDMDLIQTNDFYRGLYAAKYPKMRPFLEEKAGPIPREQQMKERFLNEMRDIGLTAMIQKYGGPDPSAAMDVFLTYARGILGFTPAVEDPPKLILQYSQQLKELRDKHDMINRRNAGLRKGEKAIPIDPSEKALIKVFQQEIKRLTEIQRKRQGKAQGTPSLDEIFGGGVVIPD